MSRATITMGPIERPLLPFYLNSLSRRMLLPPQTEQNEARTVNERCDQGPAPTPGLRAIIVIPAYNEQDYIGALLTDLDNQDYPHEGFEIIVVDNCSTDNTASIIRNSMRSSSVLTHLVEEKRRGCLSAIKTGMDRAASRLALARPTESAPIISIDADGRVGSTWLTTVLGAFAESDYDLLRFPITASRCVPQKAIDRLRVIYDVESRVVAYAEWAYQILRGLLNPSIPLSLPWWLPRYAGPNLAISYRVYLEIGGLCPLPPGDQASHLTRRLLEKGGLVGNRNDPAAAMEPSSRVSTRNYAQAAGFGFGFGVGFSDLISIAKKWQDTGLEPCYPNPRFLSTGLQKAIEAVSSPTSSNLSREISERFTAGLPPDPNWLYALGKSESEPSMIPLVRAKDELIELTMHDGCIDYQSADRFLRAQQLLRAELLNCTCSLVDERLVFERLIPKIEQVTLGNSRLRDSAIAALSRLGIGDSEWWYNEACQALWQLIVEEKLA